MIRKVIVTGGAGLASAHLIMELVGSNVAAVHQRPGPGDIKYSSLDVSKVIGFCYNLRYNLEKGLMSTPKIFGGIDSQSARPAELLCCQASRHSRNIKVR